MIDDHTEHFYPVAYKNDQPHTYKQVFADAFSIVDPECQVEQQKGGSKQNGDRGGVQQKAVFPVPF